MSEQNTSNASTTNKGKGLIRHIPNTITCCNLVSGCIATTFAFNGNAQMALVWIIIGAVFDFFDGMTARLLHVPSPIGKELDSLADDITFGVAPATIVFAELGVLEYPNFLEPLRPVLPYFAYIMAAFSAIRLAKFNLDERQTTSFIGLPTPANALFWGSLIIGGSNIIESEPLMVVALMVLICISSGLMVCELPMFALKFKHWGWHGNEIKYTFAAIALACLLVFGLLEAWWIIITLYVLISLFHYLKKK